MKTIKMLRDQKVSPRGFDVELWKVGRVYEAPDALADDLTHERTCAAIVVTGNLRKDAEAEAAGLAELERRARMALASAAVANAAERLKAESIGGAAA